MSSHKINFGIDLGTTNSAIALMRGGKAKIIKTDLQRDTMPSCVGFNEKGTLFVGDRAYNMLRKEALQALIRWKENKNCFSQFKRLMGEDVEFTVADKKLTPESLSAEVLKTLRTFAGDDVPEAIVVTIPAKFQRAQRDATIAATKLAGFGHCELLEEPIAASIAYGLAADDKDGAWMVFDFGGGTFDAALLTIEEGIMKVIDTEGDNHLGGKNLDEAVAESIIIPYLSNEFDIEGILKDESKYSLLQKAMVQFAEDANIALSFNESHNIQTDLGEIPLKDDEGIEVDLDIAVTRENLSEAVKPIFQRAVDISKSLLKRNNLNGTELDRIILVGGPTYSPILRSMLARQITEKIETSIDPMTAVAVGAAFYASTVDLPEEVIENRRDLTNVQLDLGYEPDTIEESEHITIKLTDGVKSDPAQKYSVEFERDDGGWRSGKQEFDTVGEIIEVSLESGRANVFNVLISDELGNRIECEPNQITILQGLKIASATLPYNYGFGIEDTERKRAVFKPIRGLEKSKPIPATGVDNGLRTQKTIHPGSPDKIRIPLYEGQNDASGTSVIYSNLIYDFILLTGDDINSTLPEGSEVELTVKMGNEVSISAYFPTLDFTHDVKIPIETRIQQIDDEWLSAEVEKAKQMAGMLETDADDSELQNIEKELAELERYLDSGKADVDRKREVLNRLRNQFRVLEKLQDESEWPVTESKLKEVFYDFESLFEESEHVLEDRPARLFHQLIKECRSSVPQIIKEENIKVARDLIGKLRSANYALLDIVMGVHLEIQLLKEFQEDFEAHDWKDEAKARVLLNQGFKMVAGTPDKKQLRMLLREVFDLLPADEKSKVSDSDLELLTE